MLDRGKLHIALREFTDKRRPITLSLPEIVKSLWCLLVKYEKEIQESAGEDAVTWHEPLGSFYAFDQCIEKYHVIGIDGSQVYPSRHERVACYLINIGYFDCRYQNPSVVSCASDPYLYDDHHEYVALPSDLVDLRRTELELNVGLMRAEGSSDGSAIVFFDGTLIFWHLQHKDERTRELFLTRYHELLKQYHDRKIPILGYISLPNARDIVHLIKKSIKSLKKLPAFPQELAGCSHDFFAYLYDRLIIPLAPHMRSTVFEPHGALSSSYHTATKPLFCYVNVGAEIARIEFPLWVYNDKVVFSRCLAVLRDQCLKGGGYPLALAEAHEAAVIKQTDKQLFYQLVHRMDASSEPAWSVKQLRKRRIGM